MLLLDNKLLLNVAYTYTVKLHFLHVTILLRENIHKFMERKTIFFLETCKILRKSSSTSEFQDTVYPEHVWLLKAPKMFILKAWSEPGLYRDIFSSIWGMGDYKS